jgi:TolB protein
MPLCASACVFCGCESSTSHQPRVSLESATPPIATAPYKQNDRAAIVQKPSDISDSRIAFSTPVESTKPGRSIDRDHSTALIGLYGELVSNTPDAGAQFDGGNNLTQVSFATEGSCIDPDVDRTGTLLVFASTMHRATSDIYLKSVSGKTCTQLTSEPADDVMPTFSPDARTIAFASKRSGNWDIYTMSVTGGRPVQITSDSDPELHPTWSPDGKMIAYCKFGSQSARWEIWVIDVNNPSAPHFLEYGVFPRWCPDIAKNKIAFQRAKQRGSRDYSIWTVDYVNGQAMHPTEIVSAANAALINPSWSPDGSRIVFVSVVDPDSEPGAAPSQSDLWIVNLDGTGRTNLTNGQFANFQPTWAGDGTVYFVSNRSGIDNVWAVNTGAAAGRIGEMATANEVTPAADH